MPGQGYYLILIALLLHAFTVVGQENWVSGIISDSKTGDPIPDATVYINGTSTGTTTDRSGRFQLQHLTLPCEMIISHVSYQVMHVLLRDSLRLSELSLSLDPRVIELQEVTVAHDKHRKESLESFKRWFLGVDYKKLHADILNDSVLFFNTYENGAFDVHANEPIVVTLPETGYMLKVDLLKFNLRYKSELNGYHCSILGYFFFEPLDPGSMRNQRRIARKRSMLYYNSRMHFCRSLYHNRLAENGYYLRKNWRCALRDTSDTTPEHLFDLNHGLDAYGNQQLVLTDFLCEEYTLHFFYTGRYNPVDLTEDRISYQGIKSSYVRPIRDTVTIYPSGRIPDNSISFGNSIGSKGVAHMLPHDYIPSMQ